MAVKGRPKKALDKPVRGYTRGTIMPLFLDDATIEEAALVIAKRFDRVISGPVGVPDTWHAIAKNMNIGVVFLDAPGEGRGEFAPNVLGVATGMCPGKVYINTAYPLEEQVRSWCHELAHAHLHMWHPPQLFEARDTWLYDDDPIDVRHRIARRVEELMFDKG